MKPNTVLFLVLVVLMGCHAPVGEVPEFFTGDKKGGGELVLTWAESTQRALLSPSLSHSADSYQLLAFSGALVEFRLLKAGVANVMSLPPGTWRVLVFAGLKRSATSATTFLVGSAGQDGVVIAQGARTTLALTLKAIDSTFEVFGSSEWGAAVSVLATGQTRNPAIGMFLEGASADGRPRFRSYELWNGYKETTVTGTPTAWGAEAAGTVPEGGAEMAFWLVGAQLCVLDGSDAWVPTTGLLDGSWEWLNRADMADTHVLVPEAERLIATQPPVTGLSVTLGWE